MDKIINSIKIHGYNLPVYYYEDGEDCRAFQLWEFTAKYQYDRELSGCRDTDSDSDEDDY